MLIGFIMKVLKKTIKIEHWKLIQLGLIFLGFSSLILFYLEPKEFNNLFNSFWFVMTIVSQVGLGDYIPVTVPGKLYTMFVYLVGVGFFAIIIAKWIDLMNNYEELKEEESMGFKGENQVVIINWSEKAKVTIQEVIDKSETTTVVLIDQMPNSPINNEMVHYVSGDATKFEVLKRANVLKAATICILASDTGDPIAGDGKTLLIASTIKHMATKEDAAVFVIAEILDEDHITNTNQDYIDEFILSNKPFSHQMAATALRPR
nr:potassium channel family protein [Mesobacillus harenae]